jgi:hypothetical protein
MPVFRFASGAYLTPTRLNKTLPILLSDLCAPGVNTISCHSFQAGIPSDMIKGWGRWHSECYIRYTRLQIPQRENIFSRIAAALRAVQNDAALTRHPPILYLCLELYLKIWLTSLSCLTTLFKLYKFAVLYYCLL